MKQVFLKVFVVLFAVSWSVLRPNRPENDYDRQALESFVRGDRTTKFHLEEIERHLGEIKRLEQSAMYLQDLPQTASQEIMDQRKRNIGDKWVDIETHKDVIRFHASRIGASAQDIKGLFGSQPVTLDKKDDIHSKKNQKKIDAVVKQDIHYLTTILNAKYHKHSLEAAKRSAGSAQDQVLFHV